MNPILRKSMLSVAGLLMTGGVVAGPAMAAHAAPAEAKPATKSDKGERRTSFQYQAQPNYYYCGPAATRIALSAEGKTVSQDELAAKLGTTVNGTDSALDITRVLNEYAPGKYKTTEISSNAASKEQVDQLQADVRAAVDAGKPVVANIRGSAVDVDGVTHSYPGHYLTVVEYRDGGGTVKIADPADPAAQEYWMDVSALANWIASRGYSS